MATVKNTKKTDAITAREFDSLLTYLSLCERESLDMPEPRMFDGVYFYGEQGGMNSAEFFDKEQFRKITKQVEAWNARFILTCKDDQFNDGILYELARIREYGAEISKQLASREKDPWMYQNVIALGIGIYGINKEGIFTDRGSLITYRKGRKLLVPPTFNELEKGMITIILSDTVKYLWSLKQQWSAKIRMAQGLPAVGFFTDPVGIREFLKFRDKDPGKNRRDAIIHWVTEHWRQDRTDPEAEIYVREYLRGKTTANWHGMQVQIILPDVEAERLETSLAKRDTMETRRLKTLREIERMK